MQPFLLECHVQCPLPWIPLHIISRCTRWNDFGHFYLNVMYSVPCHESHCISSPDAQDEMILVLYLFHNKCSHVKNCPLWVVVMYSTMWTLNNSSLHNQSTLNNHWTISLAKTIKHECLQDYSPAKNGRIKRNLFGFSWRNKPSQNMLC